MTNVNEIVVSYLAVWNERDAERRRALVAKTWTEDGSYVDRARDGTGHDGLDSMIAAAQAHFPGYRLSLASGIEAIHRAERCQRSQTPGWWSIASHEACFGAHRFCRAQCQQA